MRTCFKAMAITSMTVTFASYAFAGDYQVSLNSTELVHLPEPAAAIVIGNPGIADISVHSSDTLFVMGRGYGATNMIVLNAAGQTIMNANIHVGNSVAPHNVRLYKGSKAARNTFSCLPYCEPAPVLGDAGDFRASYASEAAPIVNSFATGPASSVVSEGPTVTVSPGRPQ